jgi:hypothetical protein
MRFLVDQESWAEEETQPRIEIIDNQLKLFQVEILFSYWQFIGDHLFNLEEKNLLNGRMQFQDINSFIKK